MKQIINEKLYVTSKARCIFKTDKLNYPAESAIYVTFKGNYFICHQSYIDPVSEEYVKSIIGRYDVELYTELFGKPLEA